MSEKTNIAVAYYRVSTPRQGESGLSLEGQESAIGGYAESRKIKIAAVFTEVETGRKNDRPKLLEALRYCKKHKAVLLISKLNRLGRSVALISSLIESRVKFIVVEYPDATRFILHILAAVDEHQVSEIRQTTKSALLVAKKRGVLLGRNGKVLAEKNRLAAHAFAVELSPVIHMLQLEGFKTVEALTNELNKQKVATFRPGARWHKSTVHRLLVRLLNIKSKSF